MDVWRSFDGKLEEKKFVIESNLRRRHLTDFQKVELSIPLLEIETELAKQRQGARTDLTSVPFGTEVEFGRARDKLAKKIGVKPRTFQRVLTIIEKGTEELKKKVRQGKLTISGAFLRC